MIGKLQPKRKRKDVGKKGVVLHRVANVEDLKTWAEYLATEKPWASLDLTSEKILDGWRANKDLQFFVAAEPRHAKQKGFEHEHGLLIFSPVGGRDYIERISQKPADPQLTDGGFVKAIATKLRHKGIGKYLLAAAERIISEKHSQVYLFVSQSNKSAHRFYKGQDYEELSHHSDCIKSGNTEILLMKKLPS